MRIQHNLASMNSNRMLGINNSIKAKTSEKLASGYKINRAADGAAELTISEKMRKQVRGLERGIDNISDGVSMCKLMDGAMHEINDMLQRMNELSIQAANGTLSSTDRQAIEHEINKLKLEIDRISSSTKFNEVYPLRSPDKISLSPPQEITSSNADIVFVVDNTGSMGSFIRDVANNLSTFASDLSGYNVRYGLIAYGDLSDSTIKTYPYTDTSDGIKNNLLDVASHLTGGGDEPESTLDAIMAALKNYDFRADAAHEIIVVTDASFHTKDTKPQSSNYNVSDVKDAINQAGMNVSVITTSRCKSLYGDIANSGTLDLNSDYKSELKKLGGDIAGQADQRSVKKIIFPASDESGSLKIQMSGKASDYTPIHTYHVSSQSLRLDYVCCLTADLATRSIDVVSYALEKANRIRSRIGAEQNRLEHAEHVNGNTDENTTAAESRLRDTDMADEMVRLSMSNILQNAGQSMLAQANQTPNGVMALLQ